MIMLEVWRVRFHRRYGSFEYFLLIAGATRLYMLTLSVNEWWRVVPEQPWSTIRNLPLMIQGLGLAYLILRDAIAKPTIPPSAGSAFQFWYPMPVISR